MNLQTIFSEQEINHLLVQFSSIKSENKKSDELSVRNIAS